MKTPDPPPLPSPVPIDVPVLWYDGPRAESKPRDESKWEGWHWIHTITSTPDRIVRYGHREQNGQRECGLEILTRYKSFWSSELTVLTADEWSLLQS